MKLNKPLNLVLFAAVLAVFVSQQLLGQNDDKLNLATSDAQLPVIDTSFPGGNVVIEKVLGDTVFFKPDLRDTSGEWFYWCFSVKNISNKKWFFKSTKPSVLTNLGAAYSIDGGFEWNWIDKENHLGPDLFSFDFSGNNEPILFSMGMAYTQKNFDKYMLKYSDSKYLKKSILTTTRAGREVEKLLISNFDHQPKVRVLFTARAHAGEMMSNYIIEGMIDAMLSETTTMVKLLKNVEIMIVPFLDKDGVEQGDQGKNRNPRDHNRDYSGVSIYQSTKTIREEIPEWLDGLPWIGIDLHNPWIKGENNEWVYFVGNENKRISAAQEKFVNVLVASQKGPLEINNKTGFLAYGTAWNKGSNYEQGASFSKWASNFLDTGLMMTTTLEFPFALNNDQIVTQKNARLFGQDLIFAISEYIENY